MIPFESSSLLAADVEDELEGPVERRVGRDLVVDFEAGSFPVRLGDGVDRIRGARQVQGPPRAAGVGRNHACVENLPGRGAIRDKERVFRPIRTLISLAFLGLLVWCSFNVRLGTRTFAQHADRIGQTHEAKALLDGTRSTLSPALEGATERLLGEYIEAPTAADAQRSGASRPRASAPTPSAATHASRAEHRRPPLPGE